MSAMKVHFQIAECSPLYQKKKDGLILEKNFFNVKGGRVGFRKKTHNPLAFTQKTLIFAQN